MSQQVSKIVKNRVQDNFYSHAFCCTLKIGNFRRLDIETIFAFQISVAKLIRAVKKKYQMQKLGPTLGSVFTDENRITQFGFRKYPSTGIHEEWPPCNPLIAATNSL